MPRPIRIQAVADGLKRSPRRRADNPRSVYSLPVYSRTYRVLPTDGSLRLADRLKLPANLLMIHISRRPVGARCYSFPVGVFFQEEEFHFPLRSWLSSRAESAIKGSVAPLKSCSRAVCAGHLSRRQPPVRTPQNGHRLAGNVGKPETIPNRKCIAAAR